MKEQLPQADRKSYLQERDQLRSRDALFGKDSQRARRLGELELLLNGRENHGQAVLPKVPSGNEAFVKKMSPKIVEAAKTGKVIPIGGGAVENRETPDVAAAQNDYNAAQANLSQREREANSLRGVFNRGISRIRGQKVPETQRLENARNNYNAARRNLAAAEISEDLRQDAQWQTFDDVAPDYTDRMDAYRDLVADRIADRQQAERRAENQRIVAEADANAWFKRLYGDWKKRVGIGLGTSAVLMFAIGTGNVPLAVALGVAKFGFGTYGFKGVLDGLDDRYRDSLKDITIDDARNLSEAEIANRVIAARQSRARKGILNESTAEANLLQAERDKVRARVRGSLTQDDIKDIAAVRTAAPATANNYFAAVDADEYRRAYDNAYRKESLIDGGKWVGAALGGWALSSLVVPHLIHVVGETVTPHLIHIAPNHIHNPFDGKTYPFNLPWEGQSASPVTPTSPTGSVGGTFDNPDSYIKQLLQDPKGAELSSVPGALKSDILVNQFHINDELARRGLGTWAPNDLSDFNRHELQMGVADQLWREQGGGQVGNDTVVQRLDEITKADPRNHIANLRERLQIELKKPNLDRDMVDRITTLIQNPNSNHDYAAHFLDPKATHELVNQGHDYKLAPFYKPDLATQQRVFNEVVSRGVVAASPTPARGINN
jgi:hypothetical protein